MINKVASLETTVRGEQFFMISLSQPTLLLSARLDPRLLRSGGDISPLQPSPKNRLVRAGTSSYRYVL